jgi:hypothetical protein
MSSFEILNQALITYSSVVRENFTTKANSDDIISIITNTSNELKDMINQKASIGELASVVSGNSNEFLNLLNGVASGLTTNVNNRVLISVYNADNIQSNIRFTNLENTKANIANTQLTGLTQLDTLRASGNIYTEGTLTASNLLILGDTSIVNTVTTLTDQFSVINDGTDSAVIVKQFGNQNIAEFYNANLLRTVIDKYGRIGINTLPRYDLDVSGTSYITNMYGDSSKTTVSNVFIEDIFSSNSISINSNTGLINSLRNFVESNFELIESNIKIITNTINYGKDQLLNMIGVSSEHPFLSSRLNSLEARIAYLEQQIV